jgi:Putative S-adenosyl-L-methionine-dependent methyltransferase
MLVRHYIHQRLKEYYAQSSSSVVGGMMEPIAFRSLWGEWHWNNVYAELYKRQQGQWLTPSELFQPFYSQCIAEWVASRVMSYYREEASRIKNVRLVEVGGGRGTNALCLLDYLEQQHPIAYTAIDSYVLVDSSESLLELQQERTKHCPKISHRLCDLRNVAEGRESLLLSSTNNQEDDDDDLSTIVLALEVLDNLPHDRIKRQRRGGKLFQVDLEATPGGRYQEIERPLTDPLLQKCLSLTPASLLRLPIVDGWYPSIGIGVLDHLLSSHPHNVELLIADFDMLPGGSPLVTDMDKVDYTHYLQTPASPTDILFATDFELLNEACRNHPSAPFYDVTVSKQGDFLQRWPHIVRQTRSMLGLFSPMVDSFSNCSVLTVERKRRRHPADGAVVP